MNIPAGPADPAEDGEDGGEVACGLLVEDAAQPQPGHEPILSAIAAHSLGTNIFSPNADNFRV